ncbi:hypothetical protein BY996DRAFT_6820763 [Phakopsora pachyrhizi]|nr:hypothetical protein BY996DRAFT_6820763 [Phakopsora pachyrhizi]
MYMSTFELFKRHESLRTEQLSMTKDLEKGEKVVELRSVGLPGLSFYGDLLAGGVARSIVGLILMPITVVKTRFEVKEKIEDKK